MEPEQKKGMSKQRRWQLAKQSLGLCVRCGAPALPGMTYCEECCRKADEYREAHGRKRRYANTKFTRAVSQSEVSEMVVV